MEFIYLNNFPREDAVKGQLFEGNDALKEDLLGRNIIGAVETSEDNSLPSTEEESKATAKPAKSKKEV